MNLNHDFSRRCRCLISAAIAVIILFSTFCFIPVAPAAAASADDYVPDGDRIIVSMGDSYSSGEGIEPFYGMEKPKSEKAADPDWQAHRSKKSWPGLLELKGLSGTMRDHKDDGHWYFVAASGAETYHLLEEQPKPYNQGVEPNINPFKWKIVRDPDAKLEPQTNVLNRLSEQGKTVDYVTMTLGGNDANFVKIVSTACLNNYLGYPSKTAEELRNVWKRFFYDYYDEDRQEQVPSIRQRLINAYHEIISRTSDTTRIIVAGYPKLFNYSGSALRLISPEESILIDANVTLFNRAIQNAVNDCKAEGMNIYFTSVEDVFEGHGAFALDPYLNGLQLLKHNNDLDRYENFGFISAYSVHPNEKGAKAYAARVNEVIRYLDQKRAPRRVDPRFHQLDDPGERDVVLVLDTSGSMDGDPMNMTKETAAKFVDSVSDTEANIAIVSYSDAAGIDCDFTLDSSLLKDAINDLRANGATNIDDALSTAEQVLDTGTAGAKKRIIVLMSDGAANRGRTGDALIQFANEIKRNPTWGEVTEETGDSVMIYTLGFFGALSGGEKAECQYVMEKIATGGCHYEVTDADSLRFCFEDIADQINGQKYIYIRIACPVDVTVLHNGEVLDSSDANLSTHTSFGTLTFEDADTQSMDDIEDTVSGGKNRVKILRLKEGEDYDIRINGTDNGTMNYKIGFMDGNGDYTDFREFEDIAVTPKTKIYTLATVSDNTVMNVDSDGDGEYDLYYQAEANGLASLTQRDDASNASVTAVFLILLAALVLLLALIVIVRVRRERFARDQAEG